MNAPRSAVVPCAVALLGLGGLSSPATAQTPSFDLMPANGSRVYSLSADGRSATGRAGVMNSFIWTREGGYVQLPNPPGTVAYSYAMSGDGTTVGGRSGFPGATGWHGYRSSQPGVFEDLGVVPGGNHASIQGLSNDASVAVGLAGTDVEFLGPTRAIRWTSATGMVNLGTTRPFHDRSYASGVSRDGRVVVGTSRDGPTGDAFMWTEAAGMQVLPPLPGSPDGVTYGNGLNFDGSIAVGRSGAGASHFTMWQNGHVIDLGAVPNSATWANAVNDDGTVVAGQAAIGASDYAAVWTASRGAEFLSDYLVANGVTIPDGYTLIQCYTISGDGKVFGGYLRNDQAGLIQGFVATVPSPSTLIGLGIASVIFTRRRR